MKTNLAASKISKIVQKLTSRSPHLKIRQFRVIGEYTMKSSRRPSAKCESGMSLIGMVIAIAIVGMLTLLVSESFKSNMTVSQKISDRAALEDLRQYIRIGLNCPATTAVAPSSCNSTRDVALMPALTGADALVAEKTSHVPYTVIGKYTLKAYCTGNPKTYNVKYTTGSSTSESLTWKTLFNIPIVCP